jgi:hypothetical protein
LRQSLHQSAVHICANLASISHQSRINLASISSQSCLTLASVLPPHSRLNCASIYASISCQSRADLFASVLTQFRLWVAAFKLLIWVRGVCPSVRGLLLARPAREGIIFGRVGWFLGRD